MGPEVMGALTRCLVRCLPTTWNPSTIALIDLPLRANAVRIRFGTPRVVLDAVDDNGDGIYSREEVETVLRDLIDLKKSAKQMKKALIAMGVLVALLIAMMMTTSFLGNELAKDMRPAEGSAALKTNEGATVQTQVQQISLDIYQLPTQSVDTLENIKHMTVPAG